MYRVELKEALSPGPRVIATLVPNVPCGVERGILEGLSHTHNRRMFLMYRVELKVKEGRG